MPSNNGLPTTAGSGAFAEAAGAQYRENSQYLTFNIDDVLYALDVLAVHEVLDLQPVTRVPRTPPFLKGIINLRGQVLPVVDLRLKFAPRREIVDTPDTAIIVTEGRAQNETLRIGVLVDAVREVIRLGAADVEPAPRYGMRLSADLVAGMGKYAGGFVIILNPEKVFSEEELAADTRAADKDAEPVAVDEP